MSQQFQIPTSLTLHGPQDLLVEIPALIGFQPEESVVLLLTAGKFVQCVMRVDLEGDLGEIAIRGISIATRAKADAVTLIIYTNASDREALHEDVTRALGLFTEHGVRVHDALLVARERFWSFLCDDPGCCPPEGLEIPGRTPVLEAERVAHGELRVLPTRSEVEQIYRPRPSDAPSASAMAAASFVLEGRTPVQHAELAFEALTTLCALEEDNGNADVDQDLDESLRGVLLHALDVTHTRDYVLGKAALTWADLGPASRCLTRTAITAPEDRRPRVAAAAAALIAAQGGSPVAFWSMIELAEDQSLAHLLASGVEAGFPPHEMRAVLADAFPQVQELLTAS